MQLINKQTLKGDIFGGINAGIVALPAALGFGALAGLNPIHGLYGAIFLGLFAAVFGGTKTLISNPTGPMAVVTAGIVIELVTELKALNGGGEVGIEQFLPYLFFVFIVAGLFQVILGFLKLGKYISYIPTPVVSGFMSGIGVIILVSQIPKALGSPLGVKGTGNILLDLPALIHTSDSVSILIAVATIAIIYAFPKITKKIPSPLVAILVVTTATSFMALDQTYLIQKIPSKLPNPVEQFAYFSDFGSLFFTTETVPSTGEEFTVLKGGLLSKVILSGLTLAIIGVIDALLTAVVADQLTKTKHNSDQELFGQGIGNLIATMFGGMMGAGTTPATVLNIKSGGRSRLSGIIHAVLLIMILLVAAPVASLIPKAALAGLLITVGVSILDFEVFRVLRKIPREDVIVMLIVLIWASFGDLMYAVAAGLIVAALVFMKKMADAVEVDTRNSKVDRLVDQLVESFPDTESFRKNVHIKNIKGPMFFGFASRFQDSIEELKDVKAVCLNLGNSTYMDQSGVYTLKESIQRMKDKNITVVLSEVKPKAMKLLEGVNVVPDLIDEDHIFSSVEESVMWLREPGHLEDVFEDDGELYIPTAYTPNGDGINDEWQIRNIEKYPKCIVDIYNREGQHIFHSIGYKEMWEGVYEGHRLPSDSYHYKIDLYGDGTDVRKGDVSIFR